MGMQFSKYELEASEHPQCPQLPSTEGNYFLEGYEAAAKKYTAKIKLLKKQIKDLKHHGKTCNIYR